MTQFMLSYYGGEQPDTPEKGAEGMALWKAWGTDLGSAMINPGVALPKSTTVTGSGSQDGGTEGHLMGYSVIEAEDMPAAVAIAQTCPHISFINGTIVVSQMMQM